MVPDRLRQMLTGADDGLAERLIYVWPEPSPIGRLVDRGSSDAAKRQAFLMGVARRLRTLPMGADNRGTPAPIARPLDDEARALFDEVRRDWMIRARATFGLTAGWAGKNPGRALRLALIFEELAWAVRDDAEPASISADAMARAASYLDYAADMLDRVTAGLALTKSEADAAMIAQHLLATCPTRLNERDLYQTKGFTWTRDAKRRASALAELERAGWIRRPAAGGHGRPRGDWEVSPRLMEVST
jgi:hypothetical protein